MYSKKRKKIKKRKKKRKIINKRKRKSKRKQISKGILRRYKGGNKTFEETIFLFPTNIKPDGSENTDSQTTNAIITTETKYENPRWANEKIEKLQSEIDKLTQNFPISPISPINQLLIDKYKQVITWYKNPTNHKTEIDIFEEGFFFSKEDKIEILNKAIDAATIAANDANDANTAAATAAKIAADAAATAKTDADAAAAAAATAAVGFAKTTADAAAAATAATAKTAAAAATAANKTANDAVKKTVNANLLKTDYELVKTYYDDNNEIEIDKFEKSKLGIDLFKKSRLDKMDDLSKNIERWFSDLTYIINSGFNDVENDLITLKMFATDTPLNLNPTHKETNSFELRND